MADEATPASKSGPAGAPAGRTPIVIEGEPTEVRAAEGEPSPSEAPADFTSTDRPQAPANIAAGGSAGGLRAAGGAARSPRSNPPRPAHPGRRPTRVSERPAVLSSGVSAARSSARRPRMARRGIMSREAIRRRTSPRVCACWKRARPRRRWKPRHSGRASTPSRAGRRASPSRPRWTRSTNAWRSWKSTAVQPDAVRGCAGGSASGARPSGQGFGSGERGGRGKRETRAARPRGRSGRADRRNRG